MEAMAQLGGIVMMDPEDQAAKKNFFFGGIEGCKFRRPVVPGDTLVSIPEHCVASLNLCHHHYWHKLITGTHSRILVAQITSLQLRKAASAGD